MSIFFSIIAKVPILLYCWLIFCFDRVEVRHSHTFLSILLKFAFVEYKFVFVYKCVFYFDSLKPNFYQNTKIKFNVTQNLIKHVHKTKRKQNYLLKCVKLYMSISFT